MVDHAKRAEKFRARAEERRLLAENLENGAERSSYLELAIAYEYLAGQEETLVALSGS